MSAAVPPTTAEELERDLYARLGLTPSANREDVTAAYEAVSDYLQKSPRDLRGWAKARAAEVDEAYALLSDPAALAGAVALVGAVERPARLPGGPATPPARRAAPVTKDIDEDLDQDESDEDEDLDEVVTPVRSARRRAAAAQRGPRPGKEGPSGRSGVIRKRRVRGTSRLAKLAILAGVGVAAVVIAYAGYNFGPGANAATAPSPSAAAASPSPTLDVQQVAALMQKISANPKDVTSLLGLADAYFQVGDYATAGDWASKAVTADPKNVQGYVALGAAQYNQGNEAAAETAWKKAVGLDPKNVEAHYDLGFLYFAKQPQDAPNAIKEWQTVIALDPGSDLATSLQAHLSSLTGSPAPSGSIAPSGSVAPSAPATSAAPIASPSPAASASAQP